MEATYDRPPTRTGGRHDRLLGSLLAALALHAALLLLFALVGVFSPTVPPVPVTVTLESPQVTAVRQPQEPRPQAAVVAPAATAPAAAPAVAAQRPAPRAPADYGAPSATALAQAIAGLGGNPPSRSSAESGAAPAPLLPRSTAPSPSDMAPPPPFQANADIGRPGPGGTQAAPAPRPAPAKSELDLKAVDRALASRAPAGAGTSTAAGATPARGPTGVASGGGTSGGITWSTPGAARVLTNDVLPDIRRWKELLPLYADVGFQVEPSGIVSRVWMERPSGYPQVDTAIMEAVRHYVFQASKDTSAAQGSRSFVFTSANAR